MTPPQGLVGGVGVVVSAPVRDPEHVGIIRDILGHATLDMSERYYNRATGVSSCNMLQSIVEDIRKDMPRRGRAKPNQRMPQPRGGRHV